ncbi:MAG TPA: hypothetical protein VF476_11645 [Chitinophagaceae bacterium]
MKSVNRVLPAIIAFVIVSALSHCGKDSQADFSSRSSSLYTGDGSSLGRNHLSNNAGYRIILNSIAVDVVPLLCGTPNSKNFTKTGIAYGQINVGNDASDFYITVSGVGGWMLKEIKLYAGEEIDIPVNQGNNAPQIGQYPVSENLIAPYPSVWSIKVAKSDLGENFWVSCRATFINAGGSVQTVWPEGDLFNTVSTASKFQCEQQDCIVVVDEGCAYGQGYWFGNGNQSWPDVNGANNGDITIGGENYTRDEARALWSSNNGNCQGIPDAKKAFAFVVSIKLSDSNVIGNSGLWDDIAIVDSWLESLDRFTDLNICDQPQAPTAVKDAIARIGDWISGHSC